MVTEADLATPLYSINLNNVSNLDVTKKKELKIEIQQFKGSSDAPIYKDITKDLKKLGVKSICILDKCKALYFPQKVVVKVKNLEQYAKWEEIFNRFNKDYPKFSS